MYGGLMKCKMAPKSRLFSTQSVGVQAWKPTTDPADDIGATHSESAGYGLWLCYTEHGRAVNYGVDKGGTFSILRMKSLEVRRRSEAFWSGVLPYRTERRKVNGEAYGIW